MYNICEETETTATALNYSTNATIVQGNDDTTVDKAVANFGKAFFANSMVTLQLTGGNNTMHSYFAKSMTQMQN